MENISPSVSPGALRAAEATPPTTPIRFIRIPEVRRMTSLSESVIYDLMSRELFPKSHKLGARHTVWVEHEVLAWMHNIVAAGRA